MSEKLVAAWFVGNVILVGAYDITVALFFPERLPVSGVLYQWGKAWPSLYLIAGVILGHLVFPLHVQNGQPIPKQ